MADTQNLNKGRTVTLDAAGGGQVELEPTSPPNWHVTGGVVQTNRPGVAPIPRVQLYFGTVDPTNSLGAGYDGSFAPFSGDLTLTRGQKIIAVWTGGQSGDQATLTVNGEQW